MRLLDNAQVRQESGLVNIYLTKNDAEYYQGHYVRPSLCIAARLRFGKRPWGPSIKRRDQSQQSRGAVSMRAGDSGKDLWARASEYD